MNRADILDRSSELLQGRRSAAWDALGDGVLILSAAPSQRRSRDGEHRYHPDRDLYYLTGATEPETVAVLTGGKAPSFVLFVRERDAEAELWSGRRLGPRAAGETFHSDECYPVGELSTRLPMLLERTDRVYFRLGRRDALEDQVLAALEWSRGRGARTGVGPRGVVDPGEILDELRLVKDADELELLRRAAALSVAGHEAAAGVIAPGVGEWAVEAEADRAFRAGGGRGPAYETIVGAGANACVLHYVENSCIIGPGDLVLVDAGAELGLYNGDVTRTYPASGQFTPVQREVYEVVATALRAAVAAVRPGAPVSDVHDAATRVIVDGLLELGVLRGQPGDILETGSHKPFFPHQTSHWLGLDVHDPGDYAKKGVSRRLEAGMVLTVEPGIYFRPGLEETPTHLAGIGVRIEEDVVVTPAGRDVLTSALPTCAEEIERMMRDRR